MQRHVYVAITAIAASATILGGCEKKEEAPPPPAAAAEPAKPEGADPAKFLTQPLDIEIYSADPSAHVFNGKIYIYPSHDYESGVASDGLGNQYAMKDYQVLSMDSVDGPVTVHDVALDIKDVPWASKNMWAPDAAEKDGKYYFYFPVKDKEGVFRIGAAVGDKPEGPFKAQPEAIKNSFSMDPAVFKDDDGKYYMYFGGLWGGQLQKWKSGKYDANDDAQPPDDQPALSPKVARLDKSMVEFAEKPKDLKILDENGKPVLSGDHARRFFEASWMHKHKGNYYFSYSTGDTHTISYAMSKSPYGPFTYKGVILYPVLGWTNHHSIVDIGDKTYIFYHDAQRSNGVNHLRNVKKPVEITYDEDGTIQPIDPYFGDDIPAPAAAAAPAAEPAPASN
ncbi:MAG TPA: glycoside hydrolase family 43 protein [Steroidobacteraceae bacterium]|nr:glycoside hydrolase family 43 protein [Steroidobacteraceae bacterium]